MRFIDLMPPELLETLTLKNMITEPSKPIDRKRVQIQRSLIDACDTLLDYIHDDFPWSDYEPLQSMLRTLRDNLKDEMEDALTK